MLRRFETPLPAARGDFAGSSVGESDCAGQSYRSTVLQRGEWSSVARKTSSPRAPGSSLRRVDESVQQAWVAGRRRKVREALWWAVPLCVVAGALAGVMAGRPYFGVGFGVLVFLAMADLARIKPRSVNTARRRASAEAATARAIKPLRVQGFTALHD